MSQRWDNNANARYSRERSPHRNTSGVYPGRPPFADQRPKDGIAVPEPPRGPKAESYRAFDANPRPPAFPPRGDYRGDFRERGAPYRRGGSPPLSRRRSPTSDRHSFGEYRDGARDFDSSRGRRGFRDGLAGRYGSEGRAGHSYHPPRDDLVRGRGRFEYLPRGRGRGNTYEDRPSYRPRSRSPPPRSYGRDRSTSRDRRLPGDRFDPPRAERRGSDRSWERDERSRDEARPPRSDRYQPEASPTTPQSYRPPGIQSSSAARPTFDTERDPYAPRRIPSAPDMSSTYEQRLDAGRLDPVAKREQYGVRPLSPPRQTDAATFGNIAPKPPRWNQWIASEHAPPANLDQNQPPLKAEQKRSSPPPPPPSSTPPPHQSSTRTDIPSPQQTIRPGPSIPSSFTSPKLDPQQLAPRAPKAQRRDHSPASVGTSDSRQTFKQESPKPPPVLLGKSVEPPANAPTAPSSKPSIVPRDSSPVSLRSPPTGPKQLAGVPSGPKATTSPLIARQVPTSPGFNPPVAPRAAGIPQSPNNSFGPSLAPTAPRADRANLTNTRNALGAAGSGSWQWNRPEVVPPGSKGGLIPSKRHLSGELKEISGQAGVEIVNGADSKPTQPRREFVGAGDKAAESQVQIDDRNEASQMDAAFDVVVEEDRGKQGSVSEDEAMEIDDDDSNRRERIFEQNQARLKARLVDVSTRYYRGTSPLRKLEMLQRLSLEDVSAFFDAPRARKPTNQRHVSQQDANSLRVDEAPQAMEVDRPITPAPPKVLPPAPKPPPKFSPSPIGSPELRALPFLNASPLTPLSDLDAFQENVKRHDAMRGVLVQELRRRRASDDEEEEEIRAEYERLYRSWRKHTKALESEKEREETAKQDVPESIMPQSATEASPPAQTPSEPRRRGMHATDYDLEKVLEMSKLEAEKETQEKRERDAANARPNPETEASVPALVKTRDLPFQQFVDTSCLRDPRELCYIWELQPPVDDFTQEEHDVMLQNFKDFPKKFGKISESLEGRTYKDCINHYYTTKWNGQYKPPKDKRRRVKNPRVRTGPNQRPSASQLLSNLEDAKPDLYDGDDAAAPLNAYTESGRPKRAAAPTFKDKGPIEQAAAITPAKKGAKADQGIERTIEKSGRKPRGQPKEPKQRRGRQAAFPRRDSKSPEPTEVDALHTDLRGGTAPSDRDMEVANSLADLRGAQPPLMSRPTNTPSFTVDPTPSRPTLAPEAGKIQTVRSGHTGTSSYWSVQEVDLFPQLIDEFGTDWTSIAQKMGSKSHTMVKNYFGRLKGTPKDTSDIEARAQEANERRAKGEHAGPVSTPSLANKRVKENGPSSQQRAIAPTPDVIELDDDEKSAAPRVVSSREPASLKHPSGEDFIRRSLHERTSSVNQQFQPSQYGNAPSGYAPVSQVASSEHRQFAPRETVTTVPTPVTLQYAPTTRPSEFLTSSASKTPLSRPFYQPGKPIFEDLIHNRPNPRPAPSVPNAEPPAIYGAPQPFPSSTSRPQASERSMSDDMQRIRGPSPPPPSSMRHLMDQSASRPQSTTYLEHSRPGLTSAIFREEVRTPPRPPVDKPAAPPQPKPEPRKSTIASLLNNDEPDEPRSRPNTVSAPSQNPTPPSYGTTQQPPAYPPRPSSRIERPEYQPREQHTRNPSLTYQPAFLQPAHQPTRPADGARPSEKVPPGTFRIEWPIQQSEARENDRIDHRASLAHALGNPRYNPSPPPSYPTQPAPYNARMAMQYPLGRHERVDPSPPPQQQARSYPFAAPQSTGGQHSREASISHLNPASRAPPPSVLQPQHHARTTAMREMREPVSVLGSVVREPYMPRNEIRYAEPERDMDRRESRMDLGGPTRVDVGPRDYPGKGLQAMRENYTAAMQNADYENESRRMRLREDEQRAEAERRAVDWTQGLAREQRYAPVHPPPQQRSSQVQYAPYQPMERTERERR